MSALVGAAGAANFDCSTKSFFAKSADELTPGSLFGDAIILFTALFGYESADAGAIGDLRGGGTVRLSRSSKVTRLAGDKRAATRSSSLSIFFARLGDVVFAGTLAGLFGDSGTASIAGCFGGVLTCRTV